MINGKFSYLVRISNLEDVKELRKLVIEFTGGDKQLDLLKDYKQGNELIEITYDLMEAKFAYIHNYCTYVGYRADHTYRNKPITDFIDNYRNNFEYIKAINKHR
ncbi:MAG: hypothetical protein MJ217_01745 [Bacilli bacterium]|nr:hypothetical protein [Bacilli bacterium]